LKILNRPRPKLTRAFHSVN